ncbi:MAG TPA: galactokinase [Trebonia sp.]|nr:galactokinase [Trebonia sp.]
MASPGNPRLAAAVRGFAATYGTGPEVAWSAPGRVNLIGEHTDYNAGFVLPFAIAERTVVAAARRDGGEIAVTSALYPGTAHAWLADIGPGAVTGWAAYPLGVAWALSELRERPGLVGADVFIDSNVPAGGGVSSSAALEIAVAGALRALWDLAASDAELAHAAQRAENEIAGAPTGIMDQYASLLGQPGAAVFLDCRSEQTQIVPLRLEQARLELVLIDTGERHSHAAGGYAARRASCEKAARELGVPALRDIDVDDLPRIAGVLDEETFRRARHVVTENARVTAAVAALEAGDPAAIGPLLTASHSSMRDDFEISTPALDLAVDVALDAGARGARMTGGGFGGAVIALVPRHRTAALTRAAPDAFTAAGFAVPQVRTVTPSLGAHRESEPALSGSPRTARPPRGSRWRG